MAAISNDDFLDTSGTENWNCKSRFQRTGSKHHRPSLFSDTRRKSCITDFETDLGKKSKQTANSHYRPEIFQQGLAKKLVKFFFI